MRGLLTQQLFEVSSPIHGSQTHLQAYPYLRILNKELPRGMTSHSHQSSVALFLTCCLYVLTCLSSLVT
ncbi:hypothetical protein vseg_001928 [Gypsophila vaccaria]